MTPPPTPVILVIRLSSLGDCLLLGPVFRGLRKKFPNHRIIWLTRPLQAEIWQDSNLLDEIFIWKTGEDAPIAALQSAGSIDYILDLQASPRSRKLAKALPHNHLSEAPPPRLKRTLQILTKVNFLRDVPPVPLRYLLAGSDWGVIDDGRGLELPIDPTAITTVRSRFTGHKKWIGLAPGSKHFTKRWPWEYYLQLAKLIQQADYGIFWSFGPEEKFLLPDLEANGVGVGSGAIISYPGWQLSETIAATSLCTAVVTNDSAAMHIAAGTNVPGLAFFGPTIKQFGFAPFRSRLEVLEQDLWCRPCSAHGGKICPLGHHRCLRSISVEQVWNRLQSIILELS